MTLLISGASGLIGSKLIKRLSTAGYEIVAITRGGMPTSLSSLDNVTWMTRDLVHDEIDPNDFPPIDKIIHLAGAYRGNNDVELSFLQVNEMTTVTLLRAFADQIKTFVFSSTQMIYGDVSGHAIDESFPLSCNHSAYAASKINCENWMRWFQSKYGGQYLSLRLCGFIEGGGFVDYLIDSALQDKPIELLSNGTVCRDYLPVTEAVDALEASLKSHDNNVFLPINIGSGQAFTTTDFANAVISELGSNSEIILLPAPAPKRDFVFCIDLARKYLNFAPANLLKSTRHYAASRK